MSLAMKNQPMLVYLADLAHDYLPARQFVPLGIGYIASYANSVVGDSVEFKLFKSVEKLLDAVDDRRPDLVGFANYIWNYALTGFAGRQIKQAYPNLPIILGGPNIRTDEAGIADFLKNNEFVDVYCMYSGEISTAKIIQALSGKDPGERTADAVRGLDVEGCYTLRDGALAGSANTDNETDLDFVPSPFITGVLDDFLDDGFIPILETNRGCPYSCSFCVWGISALNKLKKFSMERIKAELSYIAESGRAYPQFVFADANFGILKRDVEIAQYLRALYDKTKCFSNVEMYWSKSAQDHMVDIGRILGHLTHTYIAFQSLDDDVLSAINRKNISTEKLVSLISRLRGYTHSTRTDILVGLPGETYDSHLRSLEKALGYGINYILGGEIRMLPGSEMDTDEYRETHGIRTKYRFYEGCSGVYRGEVVCELEEVIRATNSITETEMTRLRILRALFFGSITLGEHRPLVAYLNNKGISVTEVFNEIVENGADNPVFAKIMNWLQEEAAKEWFDGKEHAQAFMEEEDNFDNLINDKAFVKLNFAFTARLYLNPDEYDAYYSQIEKAVRKLDPDSSPIIIGDLLHLCRERNFMLRFLNKTPQSSASVELSPATLEALVDCEYLPPDHEALQTGVLNLYFNDVTKREIMEAPHLRKGSVSLFGMSQAMQNFLGRIHLEPRLAEVKEEAIDKTLVM